jgi:hypothetical protein
MFSYIDLTNRIKSEKWAVRGKYSDNTADEIIIINFNHFDFYFYSDCYYKDGSERFNLDFLGKWREPFNFGE